MINILKKKYLDSLMDGATSSISTLTFSRMPQIQILQCKKDVSISFCQRTGKQIVCSKQKRCHQTVEFCLLV